MRRAIPRKGSGLLAGLAIAGAVALAAGPAFGQAAGVGNSGDAGASTGGNSSAGNSSTNVASTNNAAATPPSDSLLGGLLGLVLNIGGNTDNASSGSSTVDTGSAASSGNNSDTTVAQAGTGTGVLGTVFSPFIFTPGQSASVNNAGDAAASTGGNSSTGNNSNNIAETNQTVTSGLLAVGINLLGGNASNTSNGSSAITTGPANAAGNTSTSAINQERLGAGFGVGGGALCDGFFRFGGQHVDVSNVGTAQAVTGDNVSAGNQSTNVASTNQNVSGGLIGLGVNLLGGNASNESDGTSAVSTGEANASGNRSTTAVSQQCITPTPFIAPPVITPVVVGHAGHVVVPQQQLARTGVDPFVLGVIAFALLFGGLMFLVWERVEALPAGGPAGGPGGGRPAA